MVQSERHFLRSKEFLIAASLRHKIAARNVWTFKFVDKSWLVIADTRRIAYDSLAN
ncbi:hypothetical protein D9M69_733320 [compost metagenome]